MTRRTLPLLVALLLGAAGAALAHDMFLKLRSYFLEPESRASVALLNGTFEKSENAIARDRMEDVRIVGPEEGVVSPPESAWRDSAETAVLDFTTGPPGTYVIGVRTRPRVLELSGGDFDEYLQHDGVLDILERRKETGELGSPARERYAKHVKAVIQVGDRRTGSFDRVLGHPSEIVPLVNPYGLEAGDTLSVRILAHGEPVPGQLVYASPEGHPGQDGAGGHREAVRTRSDDEGVARIPLSAAGRWYVRLIRMVPMGGEGDEEPEVDYESNWATLTFELR